MPVSISGDGAITGLELESFEDVDVGSGASDGDVLTYDAIGDVWIPQGVVLPAAIGSNVVQTVKTDTFTTTSATYVDITGLSVTITPSSDTSKILIIGSLQYSASLVGDDSAVWRITGGNADTFVGDAAGTRPRSIGSLGLFGSNFNSALMMLPGPVAYLDSPATASPVTYKMQALTTGGLTMSVNRTGTDTDALYGRGASSLIAIEVAA